MLSSATPSPLDQLAGIAEAEKELREVVELVDYGCNICGSDEDDRPLYEGEDKQRVLRIAATLATLREVLTEWVEAHVLWTAAMEGTAHLMPAARRMKAADDALMSLLTPDSPRQAGEEITDG